MEIRNRIRWRSISNPIISTNPLEYDIYIDYSRGFFMSINAVVFDLDGVLFRSPQIDGHIESFNSWHDYWLHPELQKPNHDMVLMFKCIEERMKMFILTARPEEVRTHTIEALAVAGINVASGIGLFDTELIMNPDDLSSVGWTTAGSWKRSVIEDLIHKNWNVEFVVEDFKESADEIRKIVPVLLYEHFRPGD